MVVVVMRVCRILLLSTMGILAIVARRVSGARWVGVAYETMWARDLDYSTQSECRHQLSTALAHEHFNRNLNIYLLEAGAAQAKAMREPFSDRVDRESSQAQSCLPRSHEATMESIRSCETRLHQHRDFSVQRQFGGPLAALHLIKETDQSYLARNPTGRWGRF